MAEASTTSAPKAACSHAHARECCSEKSFAYLLLRITLALLLITAGLEKFKAQGPNGWFFAKNNWHQVKNPDPALKDDPKNKNGRWWAIATVVFDNSGLNKVKPTYTDEQLAALKANNEEPDTAGFSKKFVYTASWSFYYFTHALPYAMIGAGLLILIGFLNRLALFAGGAVWLSLAVGQMMLPDNSTVFMLVSYVGLYALAISLVRYNRFALTRF